MAKKSPPKPKSIQVCGHTVKIVWHKLKPGEEVENWGMFIPDKDEIRLIDWDGAKRVLVHELFHCILHYTGHSNGLKNEEALVTALEYGFYGVLDDLARM